MKKLTRKLEIITGVPVKQKHSIGWIVLAVMIILAELSLIIKWP